MSHTEMSEEKHVVDGVSLAYRDSGAHPRMTSATPSGPPVVLVHGMGGDGHTWDRFAARLMQRGRRVVIPDLRGHGRSAHTDSYTFDRFGSDLEGLLDHLNIAEVDMVGHSLGAYACSLVAQKRPNVVQRLVIEESPIPIRPGDAPPTITNRLPTLRELLHATTSALRHPRAVLAFDRSMTTTALAQFRMPNPQWWDALSDMTSETLILVCGIAGMMDPIRLEVMTEAIPRCRVELVEVGHSVHRDGYEQFENAVLPFLARR